jgi:orotidine-5'-phosphate decarboxylase
MLQAAVEGAAAGNEEGGCQVFAVSVLTSLSRADLENVWDRPVTEMTDEVVRLGELAAAAGADGLVCSGREAGILHSRDGWQLPLLVPGVRLAGGSAHDQERVVSPRDAARAGASYVVLGRAVTAAEDPLSAMRRVATELV